MEPDLVALSLTIDDTFIETPGIKAGQAIRRTRRPSRFSHVILAGGEHVALSDQFFSKTMADVWADPREALLIVDPCTGTRFRLDIRFERSTGSGDLFQEMASQLQVTGTRPGMADILAYPRSTCTWQIRPEEALARENGGISRRCRSRAAPRDGTTIVSSAEDLLP